MGIREFMDVMIDYGMNNIKRLVGRQYKKDALSNGSTARNQDIIVSPIPFFNTPGWFFDEGGLQRNFAAELAPQIPISTGPEVVTTTGNTRKTLGTDYEMVKVLVLYHDSAGPLDFWLETSGGVQLTAKQSVVGSTYTAFDDKDMEWGPTITARWSAAGVSVDQCIVQKYIRGS